MNLAHLNLVAVMRTGQRYPIVSCKAPVLLTARPGLDIPLEPVLPLVRAQHAPHEVVVDARPWLLFAGTKEQADKWITTNHMPADRVRVVTGAPDVDGIEIKDWQPCAIGTWNRNRNVRAALEFLCGTAPSRAL
jgi:hypothetical protein